MAEREARLARVVEHAPDTRSLFLRLPPGERLEFRPGLRRYVGDFLEAFGRDARVLGWDLYNEPSIRDESVSLLRDVFDWAREIGATQPLTACWYGAVFSDLTSIHFYVSPTRRPDEARRVLEAAESFARPVVATEALGRPNHGELDEILPLFADNRIGWYLWELMIGADQTRYQWPDAPPAPADTVFQGLRYPDGTPYREDEARLLRGQATATSIAPGAERTIQP